MADVYTAEKGGRFGRMGTPPNESLCKAAVYVPDLYRFRQCQRKPHADGWCKQHHPEIEASRKEERQKRWEEQAANQQRRDAMGWYGERFMAALIEIRDGHNDPRARAAEALEGCSYAKEPKQ